MAVQVKTPYKTFLKTAGPKKKPLISSPAAQKRYRALPGISPHQAAVRAAAAAAPRFQPKLGFDPTRAAPDPLLIPTGADRIWTGAGAPNLASLTKAGYTDLTPRRDPRSGMYGVWGRKDTLIPDEVQSQLDWFSGEGTREAEYARTKVAPWLADRLGNLSNLTGAAQTNFANMGNAAAAQIGQAAQGAGPPASGNLDPSAYALGPARDAAALNAGGQGATAAYTGALGNLKQTGLSGQLLGAMALQPAQIETKWAKARAEYMRQITPALLTMEQQRQAREQTRGQLLEQRRQFGIDTQLKRETNEVTLAGYKIAAGAKADTAKLTQGQTTPEILRTNGGRVITDISQASPGEAVVRSTDGDLIAIPPPGSPTSPVKTVANLPGPKPTPDKGILSAAEVRAGHGHGPYAVKPAKIPAGWTAQQGYTSGNKVKYFLFPPAASAKPKPGKGDKPVKAADVAKALDKLWTSNPNPNDPTKLDETGIRRYIVPDISGDGLQTEDYTKDGGARAISLENQAITRVVDYARSAAVDGKVGPNELDGWKIIMAGIDQSTGNPRLMAKRPKGQPNEALSNHVVRLLRKKGLITAGIAAKLLVS